MSFPWYLTLWHHPWPKLQWGGIIIAALVAAITDLKSGRIPNIFTASVLLSGLVLSAWVGHWAGFWDAICACVLVSLPYLILFLLGGGAGDAKMMGALGAWAGIANGILILCAVLLCGIILGLSLALLRGQLRRVLVNLLGMWYGGISWMIGRKPLAQAPDAMPDRRQMLPMRYGLAIFVGACLAAVGAFLCRS